MGRVASLIYTAAPALRSDKLDLGETMYTMLRRGDKASAIFEDEEKIGDLRRLFPIADTILELSRKPVILASFNTGTKMEQASFIF